MLPVPNYPGYFADEDGNIYSAWKPLKKGSVIDMQRIHRLKPVTRKSDGYCRVTLVKNGKHIDKYVHQVIALTFLGECPKGMEVCHGDGNSSNNRLSNLEYGTRDVNAQDRIRHGTSTRGEAHNTAKLKREQALEIRRRLNQGENVSALAKEYGVARGSIHSIKTGKAWGWIDE